MTFEKQENKEAVKEEAQEIKTINAPIPDNIDEYILKAEGSRNDISSRELFQGSKDIDLKTDLTETEITQINTLMFNNSILEESGIEPVFEPVITNFMRLKFSLKRKSREEFVSVNKSSDDVSSASALASNLANITGVKK